MPTQVTNSNIENNNFIELNNLSISNHSLQVTNGQDEEIIKTYWSLTNMPEKDKDKLLINKYKITLRNLSFVYRIDPNIKQFRKTNREKYELKKMHRLKKESLKLYNKIVKAYWKIKEISERGKREFLMNLFNVSERTIYRAFLLDANIKVNIAKNLASEKGLTRAS